MTYQFEWDIGKAERNLLNHGVSFEEAKTVFNDPLAMTIYDESHSEDEDRFIDLGMSSQWGLLVVVYTERGSNIRIISARSAVAQERRQYEQGDF